MRLSLEGQGVPQSCDSEREESQDSQKGLLKSNGGEFCLRRGSRNVEASRKS